MNFLIRFLFFFLLFITVLLLPAKTQYSGKPFIINFTKDEYRGHSQNWSVARSSDGIVYIGNNKGLISFDGSNWKIYSLPEQMLVRSVAIGNEGQVYVGTYEEFGYFSYNEEGKFQYHSLTSELEPGFFHNDEIWRIIVRENKVYFQSFASIFVLENGKVKRIDPHGTIVLMMEAGKRIFIHKVNTGLFELKDDTLVLVRGSEALREDEIKAVFPDDRGSMIIGASNSGLYILDEEGLTPWDIPAGNEIASAEINNGLLLKEHIIIGTIVDGIYILDKSGELIDHLNTSNFLQNNTVLSLCPAGGDNFWAGLDRGLDFISLNNPLDIYLRPSGSAGTVYDAVYLDSILYVATNQGVFTFNFDASKGFIDPVLLNNSQGQVWDLCLIDDELLCGHTNGTFRIKDKKLEILSTVNGGFEIKKINWNNTERLLQSTYSTFSVYERKAGGWKFSNNITGFVEPVPHFEADHLGNIWASHTNRGIYRLRPDVDFQMFTDIRYYGKEEGFPTDRKIQVAKVDSRIVFCTRKLIYTYDDLNEAIIPYDFLNRGLEEFKASDRIVAAQNDRYWCLMDNRIAMFTISSGKITKLFDYDFSSSGAWLSSNFPQIAILRENIHFVCLDNGFAIFDSDIKYSGQDIVRTIIRQVEYGVRKNETRSIIAPEPDRQYKFTFNERDISIEFSADQVAASRFFTTKLHGLDDNWSDYSNRSKEIYTRLPSGEYTFMVKSRTSGGTESPVCSFAFRILKPWYLSKAALFIYSFLFILSVIFVRITFLKRLSIQSEKLQQEDREKRQRDRILAEQNLVKLRNEKLRSELSHKSIQLANYTMTVLGKNELLIRIKEEITRQKEELGGRYPNYYFEKIVSMIDSNISTEDDWKVFEVHFDQAHENFFKRLVEKYPELTPSDMKLCAYLRLNLSTKEIAPLLNISVRGVEIRRYRLRKRLNLDTEENLIEFLLKF